jgi:hypothetical protein
MVKTTATDAATGETVEVVTVPPPRLVLFHNHERDKVYGGLFRADRNAFVPGFELAVKGSQASINWLCAQAGSHSLKIADLPAGVFKFEPGDHKVAVCDSRGVWTVNEWVEPVIRSKAIACSECPPTIRVALLHVMGNCEKSLEQFLNWCACAYQTNKPTRTAWIWSGVQGTGKGLIIKEVMKPLFGEGYVLEKRTSELVEQFNAFLDKCVILNIDEADLRAAAKSDLEAKVKMYITGETLSVRDMRELQRVVPNHLNVILTSNNAVAADLPEGDRRFNVSPRQMQPITAKFPNTDALVTQLQAEIRRFAGFIAQYPADVQRGRTAMQNAAKLEMIKAAARGPDEFAAALRDSDLQYFIDSYFDLSTRSAQVAEEFRAALVGWVHDSIRDLETAVRTNLLCDVYNLVFRPRDEMTPERVGKFLRKHGVFPTRMNTKQMRGRGILIKWKVPADAVPTAETLIAKASGPQRAAERDLVETATEGAWLDTSQPERSLNS